MGQFGELYFQVIARDSGSAVQQRVTVSKTKRRLIAVWIRMSYITDSIFSVNHLTMSK